MFDPGPFQPLPSGRGEATILQSTGTAVLRESYTNGLYMQGSGEVFLRLDDVEFLATMLQEWLDAGGKVPSPGTIMAL